MLALVASHPVLDAMALVVSALLLERVFVILAASVALALHGPYRGQVVTTLDRLGFFATALLLLCAPVVLAAVL